ncbi:hypothetical protein VTJ83DRAFT_614 [Remersonia thermophila]|uniref:Zn(2)-C6 fungal-type domain-containing protein n=1 Tax=Remersonia thermophila TaxID=72144 RepID=A0ABR4DLF8_9PEZI
MSTDPTTRRLLPQTTTMSSFSFAPSTYQHPPRETQKSYVFVDEHNRHKRLKVMRACEGCRKRKIKCDAATTNTWPCSACIRLKLPCVRPNGFDSSDATVYEPAPSQPPPPSASHFDPAHAPAGYRQPLSVSDQQLLGHAPKQAPPPMYPQQAAYPVGSTFYQTVQYGNAQPVPHELQYAPVHHAPPPPPPNHHHAVGSPPVVDQQYTAQTAAAFSTPPIQHSPNPTSSAADETFQSEYAQHDLADLLGSLKVDEAGTAPYLNSKAQLAKEEEPAVEDGDEYKTLLPPLMAGPGSKIRIPPELMPDDDTVLHYFDLYFTHAHPYVPVLDKNHFYSQWHNNRDAISPLVLEGIFAIAERLADEPAQGQQWLALASRHADSFMDVPRLSTLQALMILLKARESAPKKGYYYRSWMSIVQCVQLGKDLGLDEHFADHQAGRSCGTDPAECALKARIWQTLFVVELMIGSPQGRTDFAIDEDTVDFNLPRPLPNQDDAEYQVSRNFVYFARIVRSVGRMARTYGKLKRNNKDWGIDPEFVQLDPSLNAWLANLPADLTLNYPADGSPPWLPSAFAGNLHSYYYLSIILFNRPQLAVLSPSSPDGQWKQHMVVSYNAAKMLCRLQEAVLNNFGLNGLQCMQRGINFTIYAVLGCIVLHLVALTSPDPDLNTHARDYFTRHMRILEKCMSAWPMPDMQKQIDSVREAFSADIRKPFELKPSFPYGSPHSASLPSPPGGHHHRPPQQQQQQQHHHHHHRPTLNVSTATQMPHSQVSYTTNATASHHLPLTPVSVGAIDSSKSAAGSSHHEDSPDVHSLTTTMPSVHGSQAPSGVSQAMPLAEAGGWNPSKIFEQWNTSFGPQPIQPSPPTIPSQIPTTSATGAPTTAATTPTAGGLDASGLHHHHHHGAHPLPHPQHLRTAMPPIPPYPVAPPTFVTPAMWQESVASVYEGGLKRSWDYDSQHEQASVGGKR